MLGIRLNAEEEERLARHARASGRPKSALAREWILERLQRESIDERVRRAAAYLAKHEMPEEREVALAASDAHLRWLDAADGGYDWGPEGPPPAR